MYTAKPLLPARSETGDTACWCLNVTVACQEAPRTAIKVPWKPCANLNANTAGNKIVANESQNKQFGTFPVGDSGKPELNSLAELEEV